MKYSDKDGGTAYTWRSKYLGDRDHLQFELLGLDDKGIGAVYKDMQRMVVDDLTDGCKTILNPTKLMDDIYRIWCENSTNGKSPPDYPHDLYFSNEYKEYVNPELKFNGRTEVECVFEDDNPFEIELQSDDAASADQLEAFKGKLDEYYVSVVRTDKGNFINERRYILPPTPLSSLFLKMDGSEYMECNLSKYQSPMTSGDHFVDTQVVFTGTQNPFNYDSSGNRVHSKPEELQYGNGICGVDSVWLKVDVVSLPDNMNVIAPNGYVQYEYNEGSGEFNLDENHMPIPKVTEVTRKYLEPTLKFKKFTIEDGTSPTLDEKLSNDQDTIDAGQVKVILSHKNLDNIAKYHILNRVSNIYYDGSLPKKGNNQFMYSDFKFDKMVNLVWTGKCYARVDILRLNASDTYNGHATRGFVGNASTQNSLKVVPNIGDGAKTWDSEEKMWKWIRGLINNTQTNVGGGAVGKKSKYQIQDFYVEREGW